MKAPVARKIPHSIIQHDQTRIDEYHWLRDEHWQKIVAGGLDFKNPEVLAYLHAESDYKDAQMKDSKVVQQQLYQEILSRIKEDYQSWPVKKGDFLYYYREEKGKNYPILCRRHGSMDLPEVVYMDVNKEADGKDLYMFGPSLTNRANTFLAYGYNLTGSMERSIRVRNLETGQDSEWTFHNSTGSILWIDDEHLLVVERDEQARGKNIYRINIHQGPEKKALVFSKPDEFDGMFLSLSETTDHEYVMVYLNSGSSQVVYVSPRAAVDFHLFAHGTDDVVFNLDHYLDHDRDDFYILTNLNGANNFQLYKTSVNQWEQKHWHLIQAESDTISLTDIHFYNHYLIIEQKNNEKALDELVVQDMVSGNRQTVSMPDEAYELDFSGDWDHNATTVRLDYSSPVMPSTVLELDLKTVQTTAVYTRETPNFDPEKYEVKREYATARDGERIPVTIIHSKGLVKDGSHRALVYGYGSYGYGMTAGFSSKLFSLVDRGFVYATAHIRGGDEKGYQWYLNGKMRHKMNTFNDFIDATEYLVRQGYTGKGQIAINGGSAGGLLMGAVTNLRPDLFGCVVADVPFVDVINTISDASLPLTPPEWEEWGNPVTSADDFDYIMQYSPYDNVRAGDYPPMLFNSGISDEQVTYWEPAKMVARLRDLKTDDNLLLLNMNMHAGHAGASKRYEWIDEEAFNYAFILKCFGMK
ncbi:S9 family peptidase [Endozoicomonas sp. YOMI1]|uniref:S9 family peptidase n=1 Tax=Endozoicomonas sp. YOMI1 TaxID=2828739 RepID=UPI0021496240|nr:prolyl oligopeptidase family serine peptidase [Endozoicomonas sp. YOMI1]